jgi:hypothetical protein
MAKSYAFKFLDGSADCRILTTTETNKQTKRQTMITIVNGPKGKALITQDKKDGKFVIDLHSYVSFAFMLPLLADTLEAAKEKAEKFVSVGKP